MAKEIKFKCDHCNKEYDPYKIDTTGVECFCGKAWCCPECAEQDGASEDLDTCDHCRDSEYFIKLRKQYDIK